MTPLDKMDGPYELLEKVVENLSDKVEKLEAKQEGASAIVEASAPKYPTVPTETFEYKKKTYKFLVSGIFHEDKIILASEALKSEELLEIFVETYPRTVEKINL